MSDLAIATLAGLGGMVGWGLADFFAKRTIDQIGDLSTLFWSQALGVIPVLALFATRREIPTLHTFDPLWLALFGIVERVVVPPCVRRIRQGPSKRPEPHLCVVRGGRRLDQCRVVRRTN